MAIRKKNSDGWLAPETDLMLRTVLEVAADTGLPYAIGGALAMGAHGYRRHTDDVDTFVMYDDRVEWIRAFRARGLVVVTRFAGVQYKVTLPGAKEDEACIDLLVPAEDPDLSAVEAPEEGKIGGYPAEIWPLDLLVIAKFRSARDKDRGDFKELYERGMFDPQRIRTIMLHMGDKLLAQRFWLKYGARR